MAGFIRRFGYFPGTEVITQIEGVVVVDLPPPGGIDGVGTGTVCMVGEFADASYAVDVTTTGIVTGNPTPIEIFSGQDLINKVGGFDEFIGQFGGALGNGFASLRNKKFSRLIVCPVDNITPGAGSQYALRFWRDLPTNKSATDPTPIVPVSGGTVAAGREFKAGANRVRVAKRFTFSDSLAYVQGTDGEWLTAAAAATQVFISASSTFITDGVQVGDIIVIGVLGASGVQGTMAGTYRITAVISETELSIQKLNGSNFESVAGTAIVFRIHEAAVADTAGCVAAANVVLSDASGYAVPARPLDATIAAATVLTPSSVPDAGSATSWDPLSGLAGITHPTGSLTYDAHVHAVNAANHATLDARYQSAIDACMSDDYPARDINIILAARKSSTIRAKLKSHVLTAASRGLTRTTCLAPELTNVSLTAILADADPGVGANRSDRVNFSWPGCTHLVPEAVGFAIATADSKTTTDGILDDTFDTWLASILSNLAPERNPGQASAPVPEVLAPVLGFQRGVSGLGMAEYIQLRAKGVAALRLDKTVGPVVQSGVTTSLISGEKNIARRRMADFIQDSIAQRLVQFAKQPLSTQLKDAAVAEVNAFLTTLLSENNPAAQRIDAFQVDDKSGNTPEMTAQGIYVIIVRVRLTPTADFIVLQTEIGEGVTIRQAA
jgi:hypothetical protein